jgi:streptogramin lyase
MWHVKNTLTLLLTTSVVMTMSFVFAAKASAELVVREFAIPSGTVDLSSYIAQGADGNMWFTLPGSSLVGRVGVDGSVQMYPTPTSGSGPGSIKLGSDGNMWVAQSLVGKIAKVTPSGDFTEYSIGCLGVDTAQQELDI